MLWRARRAVEGGLAAVTGRMLSLLPAERAATLTEGPVTIDLDTTDVEVYGRKKRGVAYNYQGQQVGRPHVAAWAEAEIPLAADLGDGTDDPRLEAPTLREGKVPDAALSDEGPATRLSLAGMGRQTPKLAQRGFSALIEIRKGSQVRRLLFDAGLTPAGCAESLRRLGSRHRGHRLQPRHFDHTTGLSGLIGRSAARTCQCSSTPSWARRSLAIPGGEPFELPTTSRCALDNAGSVAIAVPNARALSPRTAGWPQRRRGVPAAR